MKNIDFTRNVKVNDNNRTIEVTKQFMTESRRYGSEAYIARQNVQADYPTYRIVIKKTTKKTDSYKGLTYEFMEKYIMAHDEENTIMAEFNELRAKSEEAIAMGFDAVSYGEIKKWFFVTFPEIEALQKKREALLNKAVA